MVDARDLKSLIHSLDVWVQFPPPAPELRVTRAGISDYNHIMRCRSALFITALLALAACTPASPQQQPETQETETACGVTSKLFASLPKAEEARTFVQELLPCPMLLYVSVAAFTDGTVGSYTYVFRDLDDSARFASMRYGYSSATKDFVQEGWPQEGSLGELGFSEKLAENGILLSDTPIEVGFLEAQETVAGSELFTCAGYRRTIVTALKQLKNTGEPSWTVSGDSSIEDIHFSVGARSGKILQADRQVFQPTCLKKSYPFESEFCCDCVNNNPNCPK